MEYFQVRYDSRVIIYERKMFIRLATGKAKGGKREFKKTTTSCFQKTYLSFFKMIFVAPIRKLISCFASSN